MPPLTEPSSARRPTARSSSPRGLRNLLGGANLFLWLTLLGILTILTIALSSDIANAVVGLDDPDALVVHGPISITGNAQFTALKGVRSGSGTAGDPYIISNWLINCNGTNSGIDIQQTSKYFIIRNCHIYNITSGTYIAGIWIHVIHVGLGYVQNCEINNTAAGAGIFFVDAWNMTVNNTLVRDGTKGIWFYDVNSDIKVFNCTIQNNTDSPIIQYGGGGYFINCEFDRINFINSTVQGFYIYGTTINSGLGTKIRNCTFEKVTSPAIYVMAGSGYRILDNKFLNCSKASLVYMVYLYCFNSTFHGNYLKNDSRPTMGITVRNSQNSINNNSFVNCLYCGIGLEAGTTTHADRTLVTDNRIERQCVRPGSYGDGAIFVGASNCIIQYNTIIGSTDCGVIITRSSPTVGVIIRFNHIVNAWGYGIATEHNSTNAQVYGNAIEDGSFGLTDEGSFSKIFNNHISNCEIGLHEAGKNSSEYNNWIEDSRYGILIFFDQHPVANSATGDDCQVNHNTVTGGSYSIMILKYAAMGNRRYPLNLTVYNNTLSGYSVRAVSLGYYSVSESSGGENYTLTFNAGFLVANWFNSNNLVVNSDGTNKIYAENVTSQNFTLAIAFKNANVDVFLPPGWIRLDVQFYNQNHTILTDWTDNTVSVNSSLLLNDVYLIDYVSADYSYIQNKLAFTFIDASTGMNTTYLWDFDDGTNSTSHSPSHSYSSYGTFHVSLTVTDAYGASNSTTQTIVVSSPLHTFTTTTGPDLIDLLVWAAVLGVVMTVGLLVLGLFKR